MVTSSKLSRKELRQHGRKRRQFMSRFIWGAVIALIVATSGYGVWQLFRPKPGVSLPILGQDHIQPGAPHEPYNSNPPTSGPHYPQPASAGFYDDAPADETLVHNLEHGYVIIWYNCTRLGDSECQALKAKIKTIMDNAQPITITGTKKLIAVPRLNMDPRIALTSWGRIDKLNSVDESEIVEYINDFRNHAPEPGAP